MSVKLTYDYVYNFFKNEGCELLETEYINNSTKMKYRCKCGNESEIQFNNFKNGSKCFKCSGSEKYSYDFVYNFFKNEGCELLETEYVNNETKMKYICECGEESSITFSNFKNHNKRCSKCAGNKNLSYETVYNYFKDEGCELLETRYINTNTKMRYICECGNKNSITFSNFKILKHRCRECWLNKNRGDNHPRFNPDRTRLTRMVYLCFDHGKLPILKDDLNYTEYLKDKSKFNIDHIFPRKAFIDNDLDNIYGQKVVKNICNLRENLRIIPKSENGKKAGKYNQEEFIEWFNSKLTD